MKPPSEIYAGAIVAGSDKAAMPAGRTLLLAVQGGMYLALGYVASALMSGGLYGFAQMGVPALTRLFSALVFPVGLFLIVIAGGELITSNM